MESELIAGIASLPDRSCNQLHIQRRRGAEEGGGEEKSAAKPGPISIHQGLRDNSQRHCGVTWPPIIAREMNRKFSIYKRERDGWVGGPNQTRWFLNSHEWKIQR